MIKNLDLSLPFRFTVIAFCLLLVFVIGMASGMQMPVFGISAGVVAAVMYVTAVSYDRRLKARVAQPRPIVWKVTVNGISVGTMADRHYAAIQRSVLRNSGVAVEQLVSSSKWSAALAVKMLLIWPLVLFWLLALLAMAFPNEAVPMLQELSAEWHARAWGSATLTNIVGITGAISIFLAYLSMPPRVRSRYKQATDVLLRLHFNTAADGDVQVHRLPAYTNHASRT